MLSRALVELFADPELAAAVAFRGGTALHKLFLPAPMRYSEDLDLVQVDSGPIGPLFDRIKTVLVPWLGEPRRASGPGGATLTFRFPANTLPAQDLRLKVEINTREHFALLGHASLPFAVASPWFSGTCAVRTFAIEELLATKLRALHQWRKGRDLFDLWLALVSLPVDAGKVVEGFSRYLAAEGLAVSRAEFEANLAAKLSSPGFLGDLAPLVPARLAYDPVAAEALVRSRLVERLPGEPWRGRSG